MDLQWAIINVSRNSKRREKTIQIPSDNVFIKAAIKLRDLGGNQSVAFGGYGSCIGVYLPERIYSCPDVNPATVIPSDARVQGKCGEICAFWYGCDARLAETLYETDPPSIHYYCKQIKHQQLSLFEDDKSDLDGEEGTLSRVEHNTYERNPLLRKLCIDRHGLQCRACEMTFLDSYGDVVKDFIEVHHLIPLSSIGKAHCVDPVKDLCPVCPNCHAVIHQINPPYTPDEVRVMLKHRKEAKIVS